MNGDALTLPGALGLTVLVILFVTGGSFLLASLFSFNNYFHERSNSNTSVNLTNSYVAPSRMGLGILISFYSLVRYWKRHRTGRMLFLAGMAQIAFCMSIGWLAYEATS